MPDSKQTSKRVREKDFVENPEETFRSASEGPVVLTDDQDRPAAIISVPRDKRPMKFD